MKIIENSRVLVTGGAGFIGSNLIERLLSQDNFVVCLDNYATGRRENITPFLKNKNFNMIEGDIRDLAACERACDGVDYVLHQAAIGSVPRSISDPLTTVTANIVGTVNMLLAARDAKAKRFVYAASSSTYGDDKNLPKVEDRIGTPLSPYAISKYSNELFANNFAALYGMEVVGLRYFNVFGRRQDPKGAYAAVIPKFFIALINHQAPVINGDGSYSRDFTYIDNVLNANQLAALCDSKAAVNTVYNVACGQRTTLLELFNAIKSNLTEFDPEIAKVNPVFGPERPGDIPHSLANISRAQNLLNYKVEYEFEQGLKEAAAWYYKNLKA